MKQLVYYTGLVPPGLFLDRVRCMRQMPPTPAKKKSPTKKKPKKLAVKADYGGVYFGEHGSDGRQWAIVCQNGNSWFPISGA